MPFANDEYGKLQKVMVSSPKYLSIDEPLNVITESHLLRGNKLDKMRACKEHDEFCSAFRSSNVTVLLGETNSHCVYSMNPRDLGVTTPKGVILGRYLREARWGEERLAELTLYKSKIPIYYKLDRGIFEGGDFMYIDENTALVGCGCRSNMLGIKALELALHDVNLKIIPVNFNKDYLHLDMICNVIAHKVVIFCKEAIPTNILDIFKDKKFKTIEVSKEEVFMHGCNLLNVGNDTIISHPQAANSNLKLKALGFNLLIPDLRELLKSGGGPRCMSFPIERS